MLLHPASRAARALFLTIVLLALAARVTAQEVPGLDIVPTTTLAVEAGNNTSAADLYPGSVNGNMAAGNVSRQPIRDLLYLGATTKIYAHFMGWFGGPAHIDVGYASVDPGQVQRQIADMIARGIDGVIIDWYGPGPNRTASTTELVLREAELHPGFQVALQEDKGALRHCLKKNVGQKGGDGHGPPDNLDPAPSCDPTALLIEHLTYLNDTYANSPAYLRVDGRPVVLFFDLDLHYDIDWEQVEAKLPGQFHFIFQHARGFSHQRTSGSFGWVMIDHANPENWGQRYLRNFYSTGQANPEAHTFGAAYKGFDDSLASWTKDRHVQQDCGATWLNTFAEINRNYAPDHPLENLQLVTWNDYEEGTEIESGIDNCVSLSAWRSGGTLRWRIQGQARPVLSGEETLASNSADDSIDHITVFVSTDGDNLMPLVELPVGTERLNLAPYEFRPGTYYLYVKAQGKAGFLNHISTRVKYRVPGATSP